jgi:DNA-binding MarR family transcriptional regulator|tara:strand:- start:82 stop:333 length:252 start_codon:yes stop_codon:yes gene_type:complete
MIYELLGFIKAGKYRKEIVKLLDKEILTPTEISERLEIDITQVSRNLSQLREKGIVKVLTPTLRKGKIYSLTESGNQYLDNLK